LRDELAIFARLMAVIEQRRTARPEDSYTAQLLAGGVDAISAKILEEARELVAAAAEPGESRRQHVAHEAADLIYHLFVMLAACGVPLGEVEAVLAGRFGVSGIDEKASCSGGGEP
jgi:phosphoribosyl-ATP pyrophosphohydrolase